MAMWRSLLPYFYQSPNSEILLVPRPDADKKSKFGLGPAVCCGFLEAHNPKSPKHGLEELPVDKA